jgi:transmembrane sensor
MTSPQSQSSVRDIVRQEAIEWLISFCEGEMNPHQCGEFEVWLKASPEHVRAYLQVSAFWEAAGNLNRARQSVDELVRRAAAQHDIIPFDRARFARDSRPADSSARRRYFAIAAGVVLAVLLGGMAVFWQLSRPPVYATQVGEERTIRLADTSVVQLNARSRIRVQFTDAERTVDLIEGQALFRVAKDAARPFIVQSGSTRVRAVGTEFDVYRKSSGTLVTVVEGKVAVFREANATADPRDSTAEGQSRVENLPSSEVSASGTALGGISLSAGEQVLVSQNSVTEPKRANPAVATAWTQGKLIFDQTPLADVVQEINRYNPRPLSIDDPSLLSLHVSGTFATRDSEEIIQFLSQRFGLVRHESPDGIRLSHK